MYVYRRQVSSHPVHNPPTVLTHTPETKIPQPRCSIPTTTRLVPRNQDLLSQTLHSPTGTSHPLASRHVTSHVTVKMWTRKNITACSVTTLRGLFSIASACYILTPISGWIKCCVISIFLVIFIMLLSLFLQGKFSIKFFIRIFTSLDFNVP